MKKLILTVAVATMIAGVVFVACQKEITKTDKKEVIKQGVKQQKMGNFPMEEFPNLLYSHDGVNFFDENGAEITGIRVDFEEANRKADIGINENGHEYIIAFEGEGDNCGVAIIWYDKAEMSWEALYAICPDGRIIIASNINPNADPMDIPSTFFISENGHDGPFYDEFGNSVEMAPIYEPPVGEGGLSSVGNTYRVTCNGNGTTCGRVWVDINGVDHEGVYWCTPDRENYVIDLSWKLGRPKN